MAILNVQYLFSEVTESTMSSENLKAKFNNGVKKKKKRGQCLKLLKQLHDNVKVG